MAENLTIARPYAQAIFDLAVQDHDLDQWQRMLEAMAAACRDADFLAYLNDAVSTHTAAQSLISLLSDLLNDKGRNLIYLIEENNRFNVVPEICTEFASMRQAYEQTLIAELTSARPIDQAELEALKHKLAAKYGSRKVELKQVIDPALIGGAILKVGDEVIDASVKTSLKALSSTLR